MSDDTQSNVNGQHPKNSSELTADVKTPPSAEEIDPQQPAPYIPQPRGEARISGISLDCIDARLAECTEFFQKHCDETDYRNLDWYQWRMQLRYAAGDDIFEIVDDAFLAARCLHERHAMHLELKPPEMFMTRRIMPVELGIISGMPMLTLEFSATYGLPLMMVLGQTAPEDLMSEANLMTSYFRRGFCADFVELTGLSAVIYAGVIAAIGRGFDDEATLGLNTYAKARDSLRGMPPAALLPKIKRYDALNTALACLCAGNIELIGDILAPEAEAFAADQARRAGNDYLNPGKMPPPKYFDTAILTILSLGVLREQVIELPKTGAIAGYRDFLRGLTEMPERRIEVPGLDEEARRILQEAGVDPDQLQGNYADNSYRDAKEESEARAAALFEERQRKAQEAVKEKIARGIAEEEMHTSVDPENFQQEKLKLKDDEDDGSPKKSFDSFFSDDDDVDAGARRANEEIEEKPRETKDFSAFFEGDDDNPRAEFVEEEEEKPQSELKNTDFSAFFTGEDDAEDASIRAHVEQEAQASQDTGQSYASFFDNLDENAIPQFDDGSNDQTQPQPVQSYSADFFSEEKKPLSGLKMTLDEPEEKIEEKPKTQEIHKEEQKAEYTPTVEDNSPRRDFTKLFDESIPAPTIGLRMALDDDENEKMLAEAREKVTAKPDLVVPKEDEHLEDNSPRVDYSHMFDEEERASIPTHDEANDARDAQIKELEAEQARKSAQQAADRESGKLKLELDGTEQEVKVAESYQQRMARLIAEKQAAAREEALREREEALRELEELKKQGPKAPVVEQLQLTPTISDDPDDQVKKVAPEDLVIKGFAYDDLDMIHANTATREELDEDFDLHAAMAQKAHEEASQNTESAAKPPQQSDDDILPKPGV